MKMRRLRFGLTTVACGVLFTLLALLAPSGAAQRSRPATVLDAFARAWATVRGYSATVKVFERKGSRVQNVVFDYTFRKPSNVTVRVVEGQNAGVTLLWDGGGTVVAHRGSGLAAMFKRTLSLHDPQVTTIRGSSIDELSFGKILTHARQTRGTLSLSTGAVIGGVATEAVTLKPADPGSDAGLTREVIEISTKTHLPLQVLGYQGPALVRKIDYVDVKLVQ